MNVEDVIELDHVVVQRLFVGDELPVRYVPQSRYFQPQEFDVHGDWLPEEAIEKLNREQRLTIRRKVKSGAGVAEIQLEWE
jgi:hypothetical protein